MWRKTTFGHCSCLAAATAWAAFRRLVLRVADLGSLGALFVPGRPPMDVHHGVRAD
jgi:hypothetical protein